jgi:hypothetical protein
MSAGALDILSDVGSDIFCGIHKLSQPGAAPLDDGENAVLVLAWHPRAGTIRIRVGPPFPTETPGPPKLLPKSDGDLSDRAGIAVPDAPKEEVQFSGIGEAKVKHVLTVEDGCGLRMDDPADEEEPDYGPRPSLMAGTHGVQAGLSY